MRELWRRIDALLRRRSFDRDLEEELRFHLDMKARETGDRVAASRALGSALLVRERAREAWGWRRVDEVLWDIRYALRQFRQNPGFTALAVLTLAFGIGVNAAVFTVTNATLFKGFPLVHRNDRLLYITTNRWCCVSYLDFEDWRAQSKSFDGMALVHGLGTTFSDRTGVPEPAFLTEVSADTFRLAGQAPVLGRDFAPSDEAPGAAPVAILRYRFWEGRLGKDPMASAGRFGSVAS